MILVRALRWRVILQPEPGQEPRTWHLFGCLNVAYFVNNILPFQTGDLWRAFLLSELNGTSATRTLSSVVVERVLDVLTLLVLLLVLVPFLDIPSWAKGPSITFACVFSALAVALLVAALKRSFALRVFDRLLEFAPARARPKLRQMAGAFLDGLAVMTRPRVTAQLFAYSLVVWLLASSVMFAGLRAFDVDLGPGAAVFLIVATTFGFFVPSTPGAFGLYHAIVIATLENFFGIDKNVAVSCALVIHLVFYLPPMIIGPLFLLRERRVWRRGAFMDKLRELGGEPVATAHSHDLSP